MVLSISRLRNGLLSRLLSSWVSLGGMVWLVPWRLYVTDCTLSAHLFKPNRCAGVLVRYFAVCSFVCLFLFWFFCLFVMGFFLFCFLALRFQLAYDFFIYCLCREPCPYFRVSVTWFLSWLVLPQPSIRIPPCVGATPGAGTQWCSRMRFCTCCIDVNLNPAPYGIRHILWWALVSLVAPLQFW